MVAARFVGGFGNFSEGNIYENCGVGIEAVNTDFRSINDVFDNVGIPYIIKQSKARIKGARIKNDPKLKFRAKRFRTDSSGDPVPGLPVHCPNCGSIFSSENYTLESSVIDISDSKELCFKCKFEDAKVSDGLYRVVSEVLEIIYGSDLTHATLASLIDSSNASVEGRLSDKDFQRRYASANPRLGLLAKIAVAKGEVAKYFLATVIPVVVGAVYGQLALNEARLATEFARKSYELQIQPNQTEFLLKEILKKLSSYRFETIGIMNNIKSPPACQPADNPSGTKTPIETGTVDLTADSKPKFRHKKRRSQAERRRLLNPRHKKTSTCD